MPELEKEDKQKRSIDLSKISILLMFVAGVALMVLLGLLCVTDNVEIKRSRNDSGFSRIDDYSCREIRDADAPIGVRKEYTFFSAIHLRVTHTLPFTRCINMWMFFWMGRIFTVCSLPGRTGSARPWAVIG